MSLWHAYFQGNQVFICADSRVSIVVQGKSHLVTDKYKKIRVIGDKVIFVSGNVVVDNQLYNLIAPNSSIEYIQLKIRELYNEYNRINPNEKLIDFVVNIVLMEKGRPTLYQFNQLDNFSLNRLVPSDCQLFNGGAYSFEALQYCQQLKMEKQELDIPECIVKAYAQIANEQVGGMLHCFIVSNDGIRKGISSIPDKKQLSTWKGGNFPYECADYNVV